MQGITGNQAKTNFLNINVQTPPVYEGRQGRQAEAHFQEPVQTPSVCEGRTRGDKVWKPFQAPPVYEGRQGETKGDTHWFLKAVKRRQAETLPGAPPDTTRKTGGHTVPQPYPDATGFCSPLIDWTAEELLDVDDEEDPDGTLRAGACRLSCIHGPKANCRVREARRLSWPHIPADVCEQFPPIPVQQTLDKH